jgi:hypothetical protein
MPIVAVEKINGILNWCGIFEDIEKAKEVEKDANLNDSIINTSHKTPENIRYTINEFISRTIALRKHATSALILDRVVGQAMATGIIQGLTNKHAKIVEETNDKEREISYYEIDEKDAHYIKSAVDVFNDHYSANARQLDFLIVVATAEFEYFLSSIIRIILSQYPDAAEESKSTITIARALKFKSIDDIKTEIIDKEIKSIMMNDINYIVDKIVNIIGIKDAKISSGDIKSIIEIFERRNVIVHNNALVNAIYKLKTNSTIEIGKPLRVSQKYFNSSCDTLVFFAVSIAALAASKMIKDEKLTESIIVETTYKFNMHRQYRTTVRIGNYWAQFDRKYKDQTLKYYAALNYAYALSMTNDEKDKVNDYIDKFDWSSCNLTIKLARAAVLKREEEFLDLLAKCFNAKEISAYELSRFPIFSEMRSIENSRQKIEAIVGELSESVEGEDLVTLASRYSLTESLASPNKLDENSKVKLVGLSSEGSASGSGVGGETAQ